MNPETNNVVVFPTAYTGRPLQSIEEIHDRIVSNRKEHISYLVDDMCEYVFQRAEIEGFHVSLEENMKASMLFIESLRAMLYRSALIDHPLHKIAEEAIVYSIEDKEED
jgi:hypothetical protein